MSLRGQPITAADPATTKEFGVAETLIAPSTEPSGSPTQASPGTPTSGVSTLPSPTRVEANVSDEDLSADGASERYPREGLLGVGGMGEVHLHTDRRIGRHVAIKRMHDHAQTESSTLRFLREARVQGQLEHPSVVPVYDLGKDAEGRPYFTMKRVNGATLFNIIGRLRAGDPESVLRFTRRKLLAAFVQVCLSVEYAHARGVFHRDLKPGNIMLGDFGEVYVLDWGLAKPTADSTVREVGDGLVSDSGTNVTAHGEILGTPLYMPPEQLRGAAADARTDVFALGAILFELLTFTPFRRADSLKKIILESAGPPDRPSERAPGIPAELDAICLSALQTDPTRRASAALELAESVERYLEGDRDESARVALADEHLAAARKKLEEGASPAARTLAMREAMKALVLRPGDRETEQLLLSLVVDGKGTLPDDAEAELAAQEHEKRREATRVGMLGFTAWLMSFPFALVLGVKSVAFVVALVALTSVCLLIATLMRRGTVPASLAMVLAGLAVCVVGLLSAWLGSFVLVPVSAMATGIMFSIQATKPERRILIVLCSAAVLVPFLLEQLGVFPPAYTFTEAGILLHPRALAAPQTTTLFALTYTSVSYVVITLLLVGRVRDRQRDAERRLFVQAWHLRQLFPAAEKSDRR